MNKFTVLIFLFTLLFFCSCGVKQRLDTANAIESLKKIRTAQIKYRERSQEGSYGNFAELTQHNLIPEGFEDNFHEGFHYRLIMNHSSYTLQAVSSTRDISFYLDQTGIIRASFDSSIIANLDSEAIKNQ